MKSPGQGKSYWQLSRGFLPSPLKISAKPGLSITYRCSPLAAQMYFRQMNRSCSSTLQLPALPSQRKSSAPSNVTLTFHSLGHYKHKNHEGLAWHPRVLRVSRFFEYISSQENPALETCSLPTQCKIPLPSPARTQSRQSKRGDNSKRLLEMKEEDRFSSGVLCHVYASIRRQNMVYLGEEKLPVTDGEEGGVGEASFTAGDTEGGVEERTTELEGAASSESP